MKISCEAFGLTKDGRPIDCYTMKSPSGAKVKVVNFGATVQAIEIPDKHGNNSDVVLGYDDVQGYEEDPSYFGSIVGRFANRIAGGSFKINGEEYKLAMNGETTHFMEVQQASTKLSGMQKPLKMTAKLA